MISQNSYFKVIILLLACILTLPMRGQVNIFSKDSLETSAKLFLTENIGSETEKTQSLIRRLRSDLEEFNQREEIDTLTRVRIEKVRQYKKAIDENRIEDLDFRQSNSLRMSMSNIRSQLEMSRSRLEKDYSELRTDRQNAGELIAKWESTLQNQKQENRPKALIERVEANIKDLKNVLKELNDQNNLLLTKQDEITGAVIFLDDVITSIDKVLERHRTQIYTTDSPPVWAMFSSKKDTVSFKSKLINTLELRKQSVRNHQSLILNVALFYLVLFVLFLFAISYLKKKLAANKEMVDSSSFKFSLAFLTMPISLGLLLASLFLYVFFDHIPSEFNDVVRLIIIIPVLNILPEIWTHIPKRYFYLSSLIFLLVILMDVFGGFVVLNRVLIFLNGVLSAYVLVSLVLWHRSYIQDDKERLLIIKKSVLYIGLLSVILSMLLNVIGNHYLSSILFYGMLTFIYGGIIIFSSAHILKVFSELIIQHRLIVDLNIFKNYPDQILKWIEKFITIGAVTFWLVISLKVYMIYDPVYEWIASLLTSKMQLGSVGISLGNILAFVITLTCTLYISKFIRFILEDEVFTHLEMPRGVPGAITMMVRLILLGFGFILAFGAAEIDISNITIIFGALGVGIGFGLQNIFNNLVSGLILAFERPIQVGDVLHITGLDLMGEVKEIGIRASIIRTFDGAEVIVPNGNLISSEMVNWTLSDRRRRQELFVGVSYGTDLKQVLEILERVVNEQEGVIKKPAPFIVFKGFGDSSLDFRILFWTHFDEGWVTKSRVGIAIDDAFKEAGITIPFPQRDLHIYKVKSE